MVTSVVVVVIVGGGAVAVVVDTAFAWAPSRFIPYITESVYVLYIDEEVLLGIRSFFPFLPPLLCRSFRQRYFLLILFLFLPLPLRKFKQIETTQL